MDSETSLFASDRFSSNFEANGVMDRPYGGKATQVAIKRQWGVKATQVAKKYRWCRMLRTTLLKSGVGVYMWSEREIEEEGVDVESEAELLKVGYALK